MARLILLLGLCCSIAPPALCQTETIQPRGVYATIDTRPALEMIARLVADAAEERTAAIADVLARPAEQMPPVFYALANVLSREPGRAYEAVFWYHVGRIRAVYDSLRCRDKTARQAVTALGRGLSKELRQFQNDDPQRALAVAKRALEWDTKNPRNYDHRWIALHGFQAQSSPGADLTALTFPEKEWPDILRYVHETHLKSVQDFADGKKKDK